MECDDLLEHGPTLNYLRIHSYILPLGDIQRFSDARPGPTSFDG